MSEKVIITIRHLIQYAGLHPKLAISMALAFHSQGWIVSKN